MAEPTKEVEVDVDINEATHAQLIHFAKMQNLETDAAWSKSQLLANIKKGWPDGTIKVPGKVEPVPTFIPKILNASGEKVKIIISASEDDPEGVVEGGVNGVSFRIQRNVEVEVSPAIWEVLKNATALHYDPKREGGLGEPRSVQAISVNRLE